MFSVQNRSIFSTWLVTVCAWAALGIAAPSALAAPALSPALEQRQEDIKKVWAGLKQGDHVIPYAGAFNRFLAFFGLIHEPRGRLVYFYKKESGFSFVAGKGSHFGGASDTGVTKTEKAALTGQILRGMDSDNDYYAAMRFNYGKRARTGIEFWRDARLLVVNPRNGRAVVVRPIDWGPNPRTKRIIDMSKGAMRALGGNTDDIYWVAFAERGTALGPVR